MQVEIIELKELTYEELSSTEGGILQMILAGIAITGACYAAGQAVGSALWYATH